MLAFGLQVVRSTSGEPCCSKVGSGSLPPKNVGTFSTSSSASVPSLFSALCRLPFVNSLYVSAELRVLVNTCVTPNYFTVFLVISTIPSFLSRTYLATEHLWVCNIQTEQTERERGLESNTAQQSKWRVYSHRNIAKVQYAYEFSVLSSPSMCSVKLSGQEHSFLPISFQRLV
jgi:hypothetical protein